MRGGGALRVVRTCRLDCPDRFVWLRGFTDGRSRLSGLAAFYSGPARAAHGPAATMLDSDDVLLLRGIVATGGRCAVFQT